MIWHADLHSHTDASDGLLPPDELVRLAAGRGVRALAVTDHDTTAGLHRAADAGRALGLEIVSGIEISAWLEREVHILGLFIDPDDAPLQRAMNERAESRRERVREIAARLTELGAPIDAERILLDARGRAGNVGRPHIARALVAAGHVATMDEAFRRFLGRDAAAYVPIARLDARDAIALVHGAGGVASLAHPGIEGIDPLIPGLAADGLDALEIRHPAHSAEATSRYAGLVNLLRLEASGGSDFHSHEGAPRPGDHGIGETSLERLRARAPKPFVLA